jgi:hypothetical protein
MVPGEGGIVFGVVLGKGAFGIVRSFHKISSHYRPYVTITVGYIT